jgi:hypothetical protein
MMNELIAKRGPRSSRQLNSTINPPSIADDDDPRVSLNTVRPEELSKAILGQLAAANLPKPDKFDPFPEALGAKILDELIGSAQEGRFSKDNLNANGEIKGISDRNVLFYLRPILDAIAPTPNGMSCYKDKFQSNVWPTRVFAALHETGHFVAASLGLNDQVFRSIISNEPAPLIKHMERTIRANVTERIADATASLYILSNYRDVNVITAFRDFRLAIPEPTHHTTSSIAAVASAFARTPRYGLNLVEAEMWATKVVSSQHGLIHEYLTAAKDYKAMLAMWSTKPQETSNPPDPGDRPRGFPREAAARDRFCTFSPIPTAPKGPPF